MRHEHGFRDATRLADATRRFLGVIDPIDRVDRVGVATTRGRVLAEAVVADRNVPHYDRAAMDGWAVRAEDTHGAGKHSPRSLTVVDDGEVGAGEAARVHTGSPIPTGADAVVMIEDADRVGGHVEVRTAVPTGRHVGDAGEDIAEGEVVLAAGTTLTPSCMSLLKSLEVEHVPVYERPEVAVIPTGEELVQADPDPGEVIETNGMLVAEYVDDWGGRARYRDVVPDDPEALRAALERDVDADLLVTTGGSSVGERDHMPEVVDELGEMLVHGVAIQPGHPVGLAHIDGTPHVLLPGYPVSCAVTSISLVRPALRKLGHFREVPDPAVSCTLTRKVTSKVGRRSYVRVRLDTADGRTVADPVMTSGAGILSSLAQTDAIVEVPEELEGYDAGEEVTAIYWE